jgi:hypothetical protein
MLRDPAQKGRPFEPRTVRMKSELRGAGRVALPLVFQRGDNNQWRAKWLHVYLTGVPSANRVEENQVSVSKLVRALAEREQLTVRYLIDLMPDGTTTELLRNGEPLPDEPVTYIGVERPEGLHPDSRVISLENLRDVVPA